jgi:hypothetical protein
MLTAGGDEAILTNYFPGAPTVEHFLTIDGGCSRISVSTHQGARHRRFLTLIVRTPGSPSAPAKGPAVERFLTIDGGRSRILQQHLPRAPPSTFSSIDGGCSRILQQHPPGGPTSTFLSVHGGRSRILQHRLPGGRRQCSALSGSRSQFSGNTSQGATTVHNAIMSRKFFLKYFFGSSYC